MSFSTEMIVFSMSESAREVYMTLRDKKLKVGQIEKKTKYSPITIRQANKKFKRLKVSKTNIRSHRF